MKKLFKTMFMMVALTGSMLFVSCGDDTDDGSGSGTESKAPTLTLNNGATSTTTSVAEDTIWLNVVASADTDRKIKKVTITRAISGQSTNTIVDKTHDGKDLVLNHADLIAGVLVINEGDKITYTVTVTDDKDKTATANYEVTIASMATSGQILLGTPGNTSNEYKFFGTAENFRRYRPGSTGADLAKDNSAKVDFLYFYSTDGSVGNALYSPSHPFGAGSGWNAELATWPTKNVTLLKQTDITSAAFDALTGSQFLTELELIDFSTGTVTRLANLSAPYVLAYKKADGKRGLIKVVNTAQNNTNGVIVLVCKAEL